MKFKKIGISTDEIPCASFKRGNQILIIIRVVLNRSELQTAFSRFGNQCQCNDPTINFFMREGKIPAHSWICETASNLIKDCTRPNKLERLIVQQTAKDAPRWSLGPNAGTHIDIGI